jgi:hypothetical protein
MAFAIFNKNRFFPKNLLSAGYYKLVFDFGYVFRQAVMHNLWKKTDVV